MFELPNRVRHENGRNRFCDIKFGRYVGSMSVQYVRAKELLEAELGEDIVALDVDGGLCFGFNSVAADIWRLLDRPRDFESLMQLLQEQYEVGAERCAADLKASLADLDARGLVRSIGSD